jgi:hypothetical protein
MNTCWASSLRLPVVLAATLLQTPASMSDQRDSKPSAAPKNIVELQTTRTIEADSLADGAGRHGTVTLANLNPAINSQFLLSLQLPDRPQALNYHIENPAPATQRLSLRNGAPGHLSLDTGNKTVQCALWPDGSLEKARKSPHAFAPWCDGYLYLRNPVRGSQTVLEATTQFLRDHVWFGEQIVGFVRSEFYQDAFMERASTQTDAANRSRVPASHNGPPPARMISSGVPREIRASGLGIDFGVSGPLVQGQWYAAAGLDGIDVSVVQPGALSEGNVASTGRGRSLDSVESEALVYLVAFDLAEYEIGYALGTEHPRLGWSARTQEVARDTHLPGPDGIANAAPLIRTGMVSPALQSRVVATFTGGFKREHGAFRYGALATVNHASHYGFVEQGVVFSRLNPGLSTLYVLNDGSVGMKTWTKADDRMLGQIRHARQNGVPLIERAPTGGGSIFGSLVDAWGPGNWSGSADEKLRTLRAGACLIEHAGRQFLVYAYFSTATPRAMARVFYAYGCSYAMHLDMNALEHTYLALYRPIGEHMHLEYLVGAMAVLDKSTGATVQPRFLGRADDRDFFYLMARKTKP